jgi:hypothetical protein
MARVLENLRHVMEKIMWDCGLKVKWEHEPDASTDSLSNRFEGYSMYGLARPPVTTISAMQVVLKIALRILDRPVHPIFKTRSDLANKYTMVDIPSYLLVSERCMKRLRPSDIIDVLLGEVDRGFADRSMAIWMTMREERARGSRYEPDEMGFRFRPCHVGFGRD